ncbi:MAG: leucine-rich repeat protein [Lachnospiraceae bacterium]|nr:leucine-rich repeat protein [Lachnospiraceae bacterium]
MKKQFTKFLAVLIAAAFVITSAPYIPGIEASAAKKPKLNKKSIALWEGDTYTLKVKRAKVKKLKWKSDDTSVAKVSSKGKVKAKHRGNAVITASFRYKGKKKKLRCTVYVYSNDYNEDKNDDPDNESYSAPSPSSSPRPALKPVQSSYYDNKGNGGTGNVTPVKTPSDTDITEPDITPTATETKKPADTPTVTPTPEPSLTPDKVTDDGFTISPSGELKSYSGTDTVIKIPDMVISIGKDAFKNNMTVTGIEIPAGVTFIPASAFDGCRNLESIKVDEANPEYLSTSAASDGSIIESNSIMSIDDENKDGIAVIRGCSTSIIPDGVTRIATGAFAGCSGLTEVKLPDTLKTISADAFEGTGLTELNIPEGVTSIASDAFKNCKSLSIIRYTGAVDGAPWGAVNAEVLKKGFDIENTGIKLTVRASGVYSNWEGTSNAAQFKDNEGKYCYAYDNGNNITIVKSDGSCLTFPKVEPTFGNVVMDKNGSYYVVTGKENTDNTSDKSTQTVFISKYDSEGNLIKTVGDDGSSSLATYFDDSYRTKIPFEAGTCRASIHGDYLTVHYARKMYSGHQSDSVWTVDISDNDLKTVHINGIYSSHSFAQRIVDSDEGLLLISEGDCFPRAFTFDLLDPSTGKYSEYDIFHFWLDAASESNMSLTNNNFAHTGDICSLGNKKASFVGTSAKDMTQAAKDENEQLFIQIFDTGKDLNSADSYTTSGIRKGTTFGTEFDSSGMAKVVDQDAADYGVMWLTDYTDETIKNPQAVSDENGNTIILYELYSAGSYKGLYSIIVDSDGNIVKEASCISAKAMLNPCQTPVYSDGKVNWNGNINVDSYSEEKTMYHFSYQYEK